MFPFSPLVHVQCAKTKFSLKWKKIVIANNVEKIRDELDGKTCLALIILFNLFLCENLIKNKVGRDLYVGEKISLDFLNFI